MTADNNFKLVKTNVPGLYRYTNTRNQALYAVSYQYWKKDHTVGQSLKRGFTLKSDARDFQRKKAEEFSKKIRVHNDKITLGDYLDRWITEHTSLKATTRDGYLTMIQHLKMGLGNIPLTKLTKVDLRKFYAAKLTAGRLDNGGPLSGKSILFIHRVLTKALNDAVDDEVIDRNVATRFKTPETPRYQYTVYSREEMNALLLAVKGSSLELPVFLSATLGMRRGEVLGLTWDHVDFTNAYLTINTQLVKTRAGTQRSTPKSDDSNRSIPLPPPITELLKVKKQEQETLKRQLGDEYQDENLVCCNPNGTQHRPDYVSKKFASFLKKHGFRPMRFHDLRHYFATAAKLAGIDVKIVSTLLGHSSTALTNDTYSHIPSSTQRQAIEQVYADTFN